MLGEFAEHAGTCCQVVFIEDGVTTNINLKASAQVVRTEADGLALKFTAMTSNSYMYLQTTLLYESKDPLSLSREFPADCPFELKDQPPAVHVTKEQQL